MDTRPISGTSIRVLGVVVLLASAAAVAQAQTYSVVDMGAGASAMGLNNGGQVVGSFPAAGGFSHAFLYSAGTMTDLGTLPARAVSFSVAYGINNNGQVVGSSRPGDGDDLAFLYTRGTMTALGVLPGGFFSIAYGINDNGQIVGESSTPLGPHAFFYSDAVMTDLGTLPGGTGSSAQAISNSGKIVGSSTTASASAPFLYSGGTMSDLGTLPGYSYSIANGVNNRGQVVGYSYTASGNSHAFLYSGGAMSDLGTLGGSESLAYGINDSEQVVGKSSLAGGTDHAFLYSDKTMTDLNNFVTLPGGAYLTGATGINDFGQIVAGGSDNHAYLLTPVTSQAGTASLSVLNPFAPYAASQQAPPTLNMPESLSTVLSSPVAASLAVDGESAVVLAYQSSSPSAATFALSYSGLEFPPQGALGALGPYDPGYLASPSPPNTTDSYTTTFTSGPDAAGNYMFLALLWAPNAMPVQYESTVTLVVTVTQNGQSWAAPASIALEPPPLVLVHGIWSSAIAAWLSAGSATGEGFFEWVSMQYPHNLIYAADYSSLNSQSFADPGIQAILLGRIEDALAHAAAAGMSARTVDVVAHSMGGLVTRYLMSTPSSLSPAMLPDPVHQLITIGTPHLGSNLATALVANQPEVSSNPLVNWYCPNHVSCTLGEMMKGMNMPLGAGTSSLVPNSAPLLQLSNANVFRAIVGDATVGAQSETEKMLNELIGAFLPGHTVASILDYEHNDTIVPLSSQDPALPGVADTATVTGVVHTSLADSDIGETESPSVWAQAYYWLMGGAGAVPATSLSPGFTPRRLTSSSTAPPPVLDLTGYTQVAATNVAFLPATGSVLTINSVANVTATSSTKTITEVLLLQTVTDPTDTPLLSATQSPFSISYTPTRLGSANFGAIAVFSDNTYAMTALTYTLQPSGTPYALNLLNAPLASMNVGDSRVVQASALFPGGPIDVTQVATYTAGSGSANVFGVSSGGTVTATGNGVDLLNVSYGGVTATARIPVGACTYALNPTNQIVPSAGGTATIQVTTQTGCAWTASGGASWLPFAQASGSGSGAITLTAAANSSGGAQGAVIYLAGLQAVVTQASTACSYSLSQQRIAAPSAGANGTITATTSCPVTASSNQSWVTASALGSSVEYTVAPNNETSQRTATLTVGTVGVPVTQAAYSHCDVKFNGNIDVADVQLIIDEALGVVAAANDFNGDGAVNVLDVQIELGAVLNLGCSAN